MNRFEEILKSKLSNNEFSGSEAAWNRLESSLDANAPTSSSNGFGSALISGIAATVLLGVVLASMPNAGGDISVTEIDNSAINVEATSAISNSIEDNQAIIEFTPQSSHAIVLAPANTTESEKPVTEMAKENSTTNEVEIEPQSPSIAIETSAEVAKDKLSFDATGIQCPGSEITFSGSAKSTSTITWLFDGVHIQEGADAAYSFESAGIHEVVMMVEANGTTQSVRKAVEIYESPSFDTRYSVATTGCFAGLVTLNADPGSNAYRWNLQGDEQDGPEASSEFSPGNHTVMISAVNTLGCMHTQEVSITVEEGLKIFAPTSFTPDDNNINDQWFPTGLENVAHFSVQIFRSLDQALVYETTDLKSWDGMVRQTGQRAARGDQFVYRIIATDDCGYSIKKSGTITVM